MISKKTLKSIHSFNEHQRPGPSFIVIYILTWIAWHNQLITSFFTTQGSFDVKFSSALSSIEENQYLVVLLLSCIIFIIRFGINYLSFKSNELLNSTDEHFSAGRDQVFEKNSDIANLMATLEKNKQKLVDANEREKSAVADKNSAIKKMMLAQHELEEAKAEIAILTQRLTP